jgi:23S rRNA pseudouridine1911/1915/1917 synthase
VWGVPIPPYGKIDMPIGRDHKNRLKKAAKQTESGDARHAVTHYKVLKSLDEALSLIACRLETGRTHQIRVHMQAKGFPLIGDPLYGAQKTYQVSRLTKTEAEIDRQAILDFPRQALHASKLSFIHPRSEEDMNFTAPLPKDMDDLLTPLYDKSNISQKVT